MASDSDSSAAEGVNSTTTKKVSNRRQPTDGSNKNAHLPMQPGPSNNIKPATGQGERQKLLRRQPETVPPDPSAIIAGVRKCNWENFVNRFSKSEPVYAVDALVAGDQLGKEMLDEAFKRKNSGYFEAADYANQGKVSRIYTNSTWIQRIRIQSPVLLEIFTRVTGYVWGSQSYTFMRPFQYLHYFHDKFKEELRRLEAEAEAGGTNCDRSSDSSAVKIAHQHLRAYIGFAEAELRPDYEQFHTPMSMSMSMSMSTSTDEPGKSPPSRVRYDDLWYLFRPGDLVYLSDKASKRLVQNWIRSSKSPITWNPNVSHQSIMRQKIWRLHEIVVPYAAPTAQVDHEAEKTDFEATMYYLDYDGVSYGSVSAEFRIPQFENEKDIRDLEFYPIRYAPKAEKLLEERKAIGSMFTKCVSQWHMSYDGITLVTDPIGYPVHDRNARGAYNHHAQPKHINGDVIVDFDQAFNWDPTLKNIFDEPDMWDSRTGLSKTSTGQDLITVWTDEKRTKLVSVGYEVIVNGDDIEALQGHSYLEQDRYLGPSKDKSHVPDGEDLALLPRRVFVYSLKEGRFAPVDVRYMKPIDHQRDGFSHIQLSDGHKRTIRSAVQSHLRRKAIERTIEKQSHNAHGTVITQDFIRGKGKGLILMLHGEPGVGKTATAEAVAQTFKRPLFSISCGNLNGIWSAEVRLEEVFRLADLWDAILLLDEADVFLSARSPTDNLERNGLVSIFLQKLEYYNGILFLTTNRIGKIDQAISSRIHLILHYKRLGKPEVLNVFRINIDRLRQAEKQQSEVSGQRPLLPVESDILQFAADHCDAHPKGKGAWNGRQIRNAFMIAAAMARDEAEQQPPEFQPQLRYWHFKQVEKLMGEYTRFRSRVLGKDDSQRALLNEERDDDYEEEENAEERTTPHRPVHVHVGGGHRGSSPDARARARARPRISFSGGSPHAPHLTYQAAHMHEQAHLQVHYGGEMAGRQPAAPERADSPGYSPFPSTPQATFAPSYGYGQPSSVSPHPPPPSSHAQQFL
ncbi:hypothetical protein SODALDRAFT_318970 [Sodiomyces alkalinus F11]|uniref:AAA+ ATPase domain-containing protein n=1 Tax=Sodiomyces alkalinus (strain CBS 110278 / VKM F-3762 / F11) TaxID=1314773 RepID=A0A3N2Q644_SODAK|nr:hypothetical protein SODALDRAFT_318970 [Sodiomyces alkalinus F11]ROT42241.1 hypothetical protein SODALDRAFT_318970 [Sodiomyces alkalinus F11]